MSESFVHRSHPEAPARARLSPIRISPPSPDAAVSEPVKSERETFAFEVVSRGDYVQGRLSLPRRPAKGNAGIPLVLLGHGLAGSKGDLLTPAAHAFERDWGLAAIDFPLHGARSSPKLSERLVAGLSRLARQEELDLDTGALVEEFARQATSDLLRTLEALSALEAIDEQRLAYFGDGLGALVGSFLLASLRSVSPGPGRDAPGLRCAALAGVGGGQGRADLDAATYLSRPRPGDLPLLIIGAEGDERTPLAFARSAYEAAAEPKEWSLVSDSRAPDEPVSQAVWTTVHRFFAETLTS